mmetsp:Transcript_32643/g.79167  ORF Transcript_32643/g.79167 Transcript_32643/m.79167 type:complete len:183 (+) Transcript_32643:42-590(+)
MSEWSEGFFKNKNSLLLWGSVTAIAIMRYAYETKCARRGEEEPVAVDPEEPETQNRNKAAEERLFRLLDETKGPFKATKSEGEIAENETAGAGDIEEGEASSDDADSKEVHAFSNACAICLEEFEDCVSVVRSVSTSDCPHIFHDTCLKEVITTATNKGIYSVPCPCCRQTFVETDSEEVLA